MKRYFPPLRLPRKQQEEKIFCISIQRTGTSSVGKFFRDHGYHWAGWPADRRNNWSRSWYEGNYEKIFNSMEFRMANTYEDSPWFFPGLYKILFHRFPNAKFILFTRDSDAWFQSMINHSRGNVLGRSRIHCKIYRRETEYYDLLHSGAIDEKDENRIRNEKTMKITPAHANHYKAIYNLHNMEAAEFFEKCSPHSLHVGKLEDPDKWEKLEKFLGLKVTKGYESHENKSKTVYKV